jgi:hypothetical protein
MRSFFLIIGFVGQGMVTAVAGQDSRARNPIIFADVPDMSMVQRVMAYYMSSTTMHRSGSANHAVNRRLSTETGQLCKRRYPGKNVD